ncbi:unnamed protein product [Effrenium voratum]|nr:unnamed protein product [Effrenium voratum]
MMRGFAETILTSRTATYIDSLCEKLAGEHILDPKDLLGASEKALENKLSNHAAFNCGEMGDTLLLRRALPSERSERRHLARSTRTTRTTFGLCAVPVRAPVTCQAIKEQTPTKRGSLARSRSSRPTEAGALGSCGDGRCGSSPAAA